MKLFTRKWDLMWYALWIANYTLFTLFHEVFISTYLSTLRLFSFMEIHFYFLPTFVPWECLQDKPQLFQLVCIHWFHHLLTSSTRLYESRFMHSTWVCYYKWAPRRGLAVHTYCMWRCWNHLGVMCLQQLEPSLPWARVQMQEIKSNGGIV